MPTHGDGMCHCDCCAAHTPYTVNVVCRWASCRAATDARSVRAVKTSAGVRDDNDHWRRAIASAGYSDFTTGKRQGKKVVLSVWHWKGCLASRIESRVVCVSVPLLVVSVVQPTLGAKKKKVPAAKRSFHHLRSQLISMDLSPVCELCCVDYSRDIYIIYI